MSDSPIEVVDVDFERKIVYVNRDLYSGTHDDVLELLRVLGDERDRALGGSFEVKMAEPVV